MIHIGLLDEVGMKMVRHSKSSLEENKLFLHKLFMRPSYRELGQQGGLIRVKSALTDQFQMGRVGSDRVKGR